MEPAAFARFEKEAQSMGFKHAAIGAMVRSSYHADRDFAELRAARERRLASVVTAA